MSSNLAGHFSRHVNDRRIFISALNPAFAHLADHYFPHEARVPIIKISATCVCGSDLWPYRGINPVAQPTPMGHEYCGIVEEVGSAVTSIKPGQFVIGSFFASDNTCPNCQIGYQTSCQHAEFVGTAQASVLRVRRRRVPTIRE